MTKYLNLEGRDLQLRVNSYDILDIKKGICEFDDKIAKKFPSILKPIDDEESKKLIDELVNEVKISYIKKEIKPKKKRSKKETNK